MDAPPAPAVVLMGVSGSGKSTVGALLAAQCAGTFLDGDDFHPPANVAKMRAGIPLDDADRAAWLAKLAGMIRTRPRDRPLFLACSALKHAYRNVLRAADPGHVRIVFLTASAELIRQRLIARHAQGDHFMPPALLASQLATLEEPHDALRVDASQPPAAIATQVLTALGLHGG